MPAATTHRPAAAVSAAATATPRQGDLLATLNSAATLPTARREAKRLLKLWYPMSYNLWLEHNR
jgi:hypothetical protein